MEIPENALTSALKIPDLWQQTAVKALQAGENVIVHAPTGAGKTFVFELLVQSGWKGRAVYTVPTRALANDKRYEWRAKGWNVGIATGDISENTEAPIVVATLETQKDILLRGEGPDLLVIDEYQMLADETRGVNYEIAIACAPLKTQLLLLSGSVGNPGDVAKWLSRLGRKTRLIQHDERPVPLEELFLEALPDKIPDGIRGFWPRLVARALAADLGPILIFAPRRKASEDLAGQLALALPPCEPISLSRQQRELADETLLKLLAKGVAYHHSGLPYPARAGLVEPLAKAGALRIVVCTMGLSSGINFSMRSVLVTDRTYQSGRRLCQVRPDQLLQMFGRAGRRGLDDRGYVLVAPDKPRLSEGKTLALQRNEALDWGAFLQTMHRASSLGRSPIQAAERLARALFRQTPPDTGLADWIKQTPAMREAKMSTPSSNARPQKIREMRNLKGEWERCRPPVKTPLKDAFIYADKRWKPALSDPRTLSKIPLGSLCKLQEKPRRYGRRAPIASFHDNQKFADKLRLSKWLFHCLKAHCAKNPRALPAHKYWSLEDIEKKLLPRLPQWTYGAAIQSIQQQGNTLWALLDFAQALVFARVDSDENALVGAPVREVNAPDFPSFREIAEGYSGKGRARTPAEIWAYLGLIDSMARPTRRGIIASFFNQAEGLAVAAALEDESYPIDEIVFDLANMRAGMRFSDYDSARVRLGSLCRLACRGLTIPGYLEQGIPPEYGDGAAEVLRKINSGSHTPAMLATDLLRTGDIERARLEWRSLLRRIAHAPDYSWTRWRTLKNAARAMLAKIPAARPFQPPPMATVSPRTKTLSR